MRAGADHFFDIPELKRAMLHFKPREIVVLGPFALAINVWRVLCEAENLLSIQKLLFSGVIELRLCRGLILTLLSRKC